MQPPHNSHDSDSEDDSDYVPDADDSLDEEPKVKRVRTSSPVVEDNEEQKRIRESLWAEFQASVSAPNTKPATTPRVVKIEKRFRYAGEDVVTMLLVER